MIQIKNIAIEVNNALKELISTLDMAKESITEL